MDVLLLLSSSVAVVAFLLFVVLVYVRTVESSASDLVTSVLLVIAPVAYMFGLMNEPGVKNTPQMQASKYALLTAFQFMFAVSIWLMYYRLEDQSDLLKIIIVWLVANVGIFVALMRYNAMNSKVGLKK